MSVKKFSGPEPYRLTAPLIDYFALEPIEVKGKAEPVAIYRVMGIKAKPGKLRGLETEGIYSPLVGREAEVTLI